VSKFNITQAKDTQENEIDRTESNRKL